MSQSTHLSISDSLAKGMVHQIGRDHHSHQAKRRAQLECMVFPMHSRNQAYRTAVTYFRSLFDNALTREFETGANKKTVWNGIYVVVGEDGFLLRSYCRIPFKDTTKIEVGSDPYMCSQHAHQRLIQIYGPENAGVRYGSWLAHSYALTRALNEGFALGPMGEIKTHGHGEMMVWRPFDTPEGIYWNTTTVIGREVLTGSNLRAHNRLAQGLTVEGRWSVSDQDYRCCLSEKLMGQVVSFGQQTSAVSSRLN